MLNQDLLQDFIANRKKLRAPMTEKAIGLLKRKLARYEAQGHDVNAMLEQAIESGWKTVYPPKGSEAQEWKSEDSDNELKHRFADVMKATFEIYGKSPTRAALGIWWNILNKYHIETIEGAFASHLTDAEHGTFIPKPADIIAQIEGRKADRDTLAVVAFSKVLDNANRYASVVFDNPAIHYAIMVGFGDWQKVADYNENEFKCQEQRRTFIKAYTSFDDSMSYPPRLKGYHEQAMASTGINREVKVLYIGDKQKALKVEKKVLTRDLQSITFNPKKIGV